MTRNVYVGTNVDNVLAAQDPNQIPFLVAAAYQTLVATNFPERAAALADEIARARPHLIGLQEISTVRLQSPGDAAFGGTEPATEIQYHFLETLMHALRDRGLRYRVGAIVANADVELPMYTGASPVPFDDVRLQDFDVILVRRDVRITDRVAENFAVNLQVPIGGGPPVEILRGYTAVTARVNGELYRFVNTHLEPASIPELLPIQLAQAQELIATVANEELPVILAGDLNTHAPTGQTYQMLLDAGYVDSWTSQADDPGPGYTCCHADDLRNETVAFDRRIDLIMVRPGANSERPAFSAPTRDRVIGIHPRFRTDTGMWPSDHGGLVARMRIFGPILNLVAGGG